MMTTISDSLRRVRMSALTHRKLQERSAVLYARELDRWSRRLTR